MKLASLPLASAIALALTASVWAEAPAAPRGPGRGGEAAGKPADPIARFDKNNDGILDAEEFKAAKAEGAKFLERADANADGILDAGEIEAFRAKFRAIQPVDGKGRQQGKPEMADPAKREAMRQEMLKKFDADGDGKLNEAEMAAAKAARQEMMQKRQQEQKREGKPARDKAKPEQKPTTVIIE